MSVFHQNQDHLFVGRELTEMLNLAQQKVDGRVAAVNEGDLLSFTPEQLADTLLDSVSPTIPELLRNNISIVERNTGVFEFRDFGQTVRRELPRVVYEVPYVGDAKHFFMRASTFLLTNPYAQLNGDVLEFTFLYDGVATKVDEVLNSTLDTIEEHLSWQKNDVEAWRVSQRSRIVDRVKKRQEIVAASRKVHDESRFPTRLRESGAIMVRLPRSQANVVQPRRAGQEGFLHLDPEDIHAVLTVFRSIAKMFERHPASFETLGEEALRDHFLVQLNAKFPGGVSGETFRMKGKTDILVTRDDKHVFVAECKKWSGPNSVSEAVEQLLAYLTWRDAYAALVFFSRRKDFAGVLSKVSPPIESHPAFLRNIEANPAEGEYRFQLKHPREDAGVLNLHVLVFDIPSPEES